MAKSHSLPGPTNRNRISVQEAALQLGVSALTIRRRIADGTLPAYRLGNRIIRIDARDLDRLERQIPTVGRNAE